MASIKILIWTLVLIFQVAQYCRGQTSLEVSPPETTKKYKVDFKKAARDADALAFLVASYYNDKRFADKAWTNFTGDKKLKGDKFLETPVSSSATPLWGAQYIFAGSPENAVGLRDGNMASVWRSMLTAQKLNEPPSPPAEPIAIYLIEDSSRAAFNVVPFQTKITTTVTSVISPGEKPQIEVKEKIVLVIALLFSRGFYAKEVLSGRVAMALGAKAGEDFLDSWKSAVPSERSKAELVERFPLMAEEFWQLNFLRANNNLAKTYNCLRGASPETEEVVSYCAGLLWNYELGASEAYLAATQEPLVCVKPGGCQKPDDYTPFMDSEMQLFVYPHADWIPGTKPSKSGLKKYARKKLDDMPSKYTFINPSLAEKYK